MGSDSTPPRTAGTTAGTTAGASSQLQATEATAKRRGGGCCAALRGMCRRTAILVLVTGVLLQLYTPRLFMRDSSKTCMPAKHSFTGAAQRTRLARVAAHP